MSVNSTENETNEKMQDIVDIPIDYSIKHPLKNCWSLWYYEYDRQRAWEDNLKEIASFQTVEDFWSLYNHIKLASELKQGCDYSLFKKDVKPMWEDPVNKCGGRWLFNLEKKQRHEVDRFWLDILLCLIGEAFENSEDVCGATVNLRNKGDKIGVWTSDATNGTAVMEIGQKLKERLGIPPKFPICYEVHKDTMDKSGSSTKARYTI